MLFSLPTEVSCRGNKVDLKPWILWTEPWGSERHQQTLPCLPCYSIDWQCGAAWPALSPHFVSYLMRQRHPPSIKLSRKMWIWISNWGHFPLRNQLQTNKVYALFTNLTCCCLKTGIQISLRWIRLVYIFTNKTIFLYLEKLINTFVSRKSIL